MNSWQARDLKGGKLVSREFLREKKIVLMSCRAVCGHDWLSLGLVIALHALRWLCRPITEFHRAEQKTELHSRQWTVKRSVFSCFLLKKTFVLILLAVFAPVTFFSWFFLIRFDSFHKLTFCLVAYLFVLKKLVFHFSVSALLICVFLHQNILNDIFIFFLLRFHFFFSCLVFISSVM